MMPPPSTPATTNTYSTAAQIRHSIRPWFDDFLSFSTFSLPLSFPDLSLRLQKNLYTFRGNYAIISLIIFLVTLIFRPFTAILLLIIIAGWIYLYFARDEPLVVFDFEIGDLLVLISLTFVTVVTLSVAGVWWNVFVSTAVAALLVCLHAILRAPDDTESPYGALLSGVDEDEHSRGSYVQV